MHVNSGGNLSVRIDTDTSVNQTVSVGAGD